MDVKGPHDAASSPAPGSPPPGPVTSPTRPQNGSRMPRRRERKQYRRPMSGSSPFDQDGTASPGSGMGEAERRMGWRTFRWTAAIGIAVFVAAMRWLVAAHLHLPQWTKGVPSTPGGYLFIIIAIVLLIAPDADSIAFPGVKVELRRAKADIEQLGNQIQQVQANQISAAHSSSGHQFNGMDPAAIAAVVNALKATSDNVASEEARSDDVPSSALDRFTVQASSAWSTGGVDL
jgi:hypothetical protein